MKPPRRTGDSQKTLSEQETAAMQHLVLHEGPPPPVNAGFIMSKKEIKEVVSFPLGDQQQGMRDKITARMTANAAEFQPFIPTTSSVEEYSEEMKGKTWGGQLECYALAQELNCPVFALDLPDGAVETKTYLHGASNPGKPIFLLRVQDNHWMVCIPRHGDHWQYHRIKTKSNVHYTPIEVVLSVFGSAVNMLIFATPQDGNCFFHGVALLVSAVEYDRSPEKPKLHFSRFSGLNPQEARAARQINLQFSNVAGAARKLAVTDPGGHAFDESSQSSCIRKENIRCEFSVGVNQPGAVLFDPGCGTGAALISHLVGFQFGHECICIAVEENQELARGFSRTARKLLPHNPNMQVACAHMKAQDLGDLTGCTNATCYDGAPWNKNMEVDLEHVSLIQRLLSCDTMDEFTTTKLNWTSIQEYGKHDDRITRHLSKWFTVYLAKCEGRGNRFGVTMFVKLPQYRIVRRPDRIVSSTLGTLIKTAQGLPSRCSGGEHTDYVSFGTPAGSESEVRKYKNFKITLGGEAMDQFRNHLFEPGDIVMDAFSRSAGVVVGTCVHPNTGANLLMLHSLRNAPNPHSWFSDVTNTWPTNDKDISMNSGTWEKAMSTLTLSTAAKRASRRTESPTVDLDSEGETEGTSKSLEEENQELKENLQKVLTKELNSQKEVTRLESVNKALTKATTKAREEASRLKKGLKEARYQLREASKKAKDSADDSSHRSNSPNGSSRSPRPGFASPSATITTGTVGDRTPRRDIHETAQAADILREEASSWKQTLENTQKLLLSNVRDAYEKNMDEVLAKQAESEQVRTQLLQDEVKECVNQIENGKIAKIYQRVEKIIQQKPSQPPEPFIEKLQMKVLESFTRSPKRPRSRTPSPSRGSSKKTCEEESQAVKVMKGLAETIQHLQEQIKDKENHRLQEQIKDKENHRPDSGHLDPRLLPNLLGGLSSNLQQQPWLYSHQQQQPWVCSNQQQQPWIHCNQQQQPWIHSNQQQQPWPHSNQRQHPSPQSSNPWPQPSGPREEILSQRQYTSRSQHNHQMQPLSQHASELHRNQQMGPPEKKSEESDCNPKMKGQQYGQQPSPRSSSVASPTEARPNSVRDWCMKHVESWLVSETVGLSSLCALVNPNGLLRNGAYLMTVEKAQLVARHVLEQDINVLFDKRAELK